GLAYRIVEGRVEWEAEPVKMHADDAFAAEAAAANGTPRSKAKKEAMEWLRDKLAAGPLPAGDVIDEGEQYGLSERTLQRALKAIGGRSTKGEFDKGWMWSPAVPAVLSLFPSPEGDTGRVGELSPSAGFSA